MAAPVIRASGLWRIYATGAGLTCALRGVDLEVARGEFLAIMGPSGSGKSTLMSILGCLDRPTSGTYELSGIDVSTLSDSELAQVRSEALGFVFQSFNLLPRATVIRNVMLPLVYTRRPARERELRAWRALAETGLPEELYYHRSNELSGGQMQRVAIARALVCDPEVILADEPTGNLDSETGELVMGIFRRMQSRGKTVVLITHDPEVAAWADRVVHIRDGRLLTDEQERAFVRAMRQGATEGEARGA
ncbi:ABC transporter ATP-binding protein [Atopobiaceae bacterium HCP3S3_F7]